MIAWRKSKRSSERRNLTAKKLVGWWNIYIHYYALNKMQKRKVKYR